jgi:hypothetical protein
MKHLLNNMSEEEKNAIREQHTGGMKIMTENFNKLINSKLGDSKPLVNEQNSQGTKISEDLNYVLNSVVGFNSPWSIDPKGINASYSLIQKGNNAHFPGQPLCFKNNTDSKISFNVEKDGKTIKAYDNEGIKRFILPNDTDSLVSWLKMRR